MVDRRGTGLGGVSWSDGQFRRSCRPGAVPVGAMASAIGSSAWTAMVALARTVSLLARARRSQPRTVVAGRPTCSAVRDRSRWRGGRLRRLRRRQVVVGRNGPRSAPGFVDSFDIEPCGAGGSRSGRVRPQDSRAGVAPRSGGCRRSRDGDSRGCRRSGGGQLRWGRGSRSSLSTPASVVAAVGGGEGEFVLQDARRSRVGPRKR